MILSLFAWLNNNGFARDALTICEALYDNFAWLIPVSEVVMLPVFLYWFYLQITGKTLFRKGMAFTNGLMSESMILWFTLMFLGGRQREFIKWDE